MYQLTSTSAIKRLEDGAIIPADPANSDFLEYLGWTAAGNIPDPAEVPPEPTPTEAAMDAIIALETEAQIASQRLYREAVLGMMEQQAKAANITLEQLAAKNKGYRELKAFNQQIEALREQL